MSICVCAECVEQYHRLYMFYRNYNNCGLFLTKNMHLVWYGSFIEKFQRVRNLTGKFWQLIPCHNSGKLVWTAIEKAKTRFVCQNCDNHWTSMFGAVAFNVYEENGYILSYKLLGQKCSKCHRMEFEHAMWYPEEVERVLEIISIYWTSDKAMKTRCGERTQSMKSGNPKGFHREDSCQACSEHVCQHYLSRNRFNSGNVSLQEYEQEEQEDQEDQEEQEVTKKKSEELEHLTSDYGSECELNSSFDNPIFKRSFSMPAKSMTMVDSPVFFYET